MEPIEQVFLRVRTVQGYRTAEVVAATELVRSSDLTEIVAWYSEHEDESALQYDVFSLFFHPLPSGDHALGMIHPDQRGLLSLLRPPKSFFVRVLVVPPRTLLEKGNNPIALFEELRRERKISIRSTPPKRLRPVIPSKSLSLFEENRLRSLSESVDPVGWGTLSQSLFDAVCTFFSPPASHSSLSVLDGMINLLPIRYRTELTFSTGFHFSPRNPFRLIGVEAGHDRMKKWSRRLRVPMFDLREWERKSAMPRESVLDPWPRFICELFRSGRFPFLAEHLRSEYQTSVSITTENISWNLNWEHLHELAAFWMKSLLSEEPSPTDRISEERPTTSKEALRCVTVVEQLLPLLDRNGDGAGSRQGCHEKTIVSKPGRDTAASTVFSPGEWLSGSARESIGRDPLLRGLLLRFDSHLARTISGDGSEPREIRILWQEICDKIDWNDQERLREEYLDRIHAILLHDTAENDIRRIDRNARSLELISILLRGTSEHHS